MRKNLYLILASVSAAIPFLMSTQSLSPSMQSQRQCVVFMMLDLNGNGQGRHRLQES